MPGKLVASILAIFASHAAPHRHHATHAHHARGCHTRACDVRVGRAWWRKHRPRFVPMASAVASYYDDAGGTACGFHATYGFAHLGPGEAARNGLAEPALGGLACGTRVIICAARCVTGTMDDHGPYIGGREFDLDEALKDAIGASDLGTVRYRLR